MVEVVNATLRWPFVATRMSTLALEMHTATRPSISKKPGKL